MEGAGSKRAVRREVRRLLTGSSPAPKHPRTLGAALVKLRRGLVEQRVHGEGQVELLDVERLQGSLQGGLRVELVGAPPTAPTLLAIATHAAVAQFAG